MSNQYNHVKELVQETFNSALNHDIALQGAAIAFYTIFSAAPLVVIILALTNIFLSDQQTVHFFVDYLSQITNPDIAQTLIDISDNSGPQSSGFIASIVAAGILLFGATTVITQLKSTLNIVWGIRQTNINSVLQYLFNRFWGIIIILILTTLFLSSLTIEGGMTFFSGLFLPYLSPVFASILKAAMFIVSTLITVLFFTIIFKILPDIDVRWVDIFVGACVTSVLFLIGKYIIGIYLASTSIYDSYKTAGSFIVLLIWIYYNVQIVLLGAEFTQIYTKRYGKKVCPSRNAEFIDSGK